MSEPTISLRAATKIWTMGETPINALAGVDLDVAQGERLAILGPSGSGKSTLLNILGLLDSPTSGRYRLCGEDTGTLSPAMRARLRNGSMGFVFQQFHLLSHLSAQANVALPLRYGTPVEDSATAALEALQWVGLAHRADHRPHQLSGGERQRVAIARAIVRRPSILFADEPTGALDSLNGQHILELIESLHVQTAMTVIMITHDAEIAKRFPRQIVMHDGRITSDARGDG
jgi:putative ABC transport system ATP-binding protein